MKKAHLLVVEDEALIAMDLEMAFKEAGADYVACFTKTEEARLYAAGVDLNAAVLDINSIDGTTKALAVELKERNVPFVYSTGDSNHAETLTDWPDADVFLKPYSMEDIVEKLTDLLTKK